MLRRSGAFDRKQMLLFTQIDERDKRYEMGKRFAKLVTPSSLTTVKLPRQVQNVISVFG